ncbi:hypothetical protein EON65_28690 [archaeon]|nr:MAG: hypothetical protein EON65_28690 [archaeon]
MDMTASRRISIQTAEILAMVQTMMITCKSSILSPSPPLGGESVSTYWMCVRVTLIIYLLYVHAEWRRSY